LQLVAERFSALRRLQSRLLTGAAFCLAIASPPQPRPLRMPTGADCNNILILLPPRARRSMRPPDSRKITADRQLTIGIGHRAPIRDANETRPPRSYAAVHGNFIPGFEELARIVASMAHRQT
jgi:hypothetical protein